jgi:hypothetical protein
MGSPSLAQFLEVARREFAFLVAEFSFSEVEAGPNAFGVRFVNSTTRVEVGGVNWGGSVQTIVSPLSPLPDVPSQIPLWALVELRAPQESLNSPGQLAQLHLHALLLRKCAAASLVGNFSDFDAAADILGRHFKESNQPKRRRLP